jgi:hypothetical protein
MSLNNTESKERERRKPSLDNSYEDLQSQYGAKHKPKAGNLYYKQGVMVSFGSTSPNHHVMLENLNVQIAQIN